MGKKTDFRSNLEWLVRPKNMPRVLEGHYHDQKRVQSYDDVYANLPDVFKDPVIGSILGTYRPDTIEAEGAVIEHAGP